MRSRFVRELVAGVPKKVLFEFHERKDAFRLLTPDSENIEIISTASSLKPTGEIVRFITPFLFLRFGFEMIHTAYEPYDLFADEQKRGIFSFWRHRHMFSEHGWEKQPGSILRDEIEFAHPLLLFFAPFVRQKLRKVFGYRHRVTSKEVQMLDSGSRGGDAPTVVVTGATGLVGKRVVQILAEQGVKVIAFVRDLSNAGEALGDRVVFAQWDFDHPEKGDWKKYLQGVHGVIHLAGTPLFKQRWTPAFKRRMEDSRVLGTRQLVEAIEELDQKPRAFVSASAMGIYGTDPSRTVDEDTEPSDDLLARICRNWEAESQVLSTTRSVQIRMGVVLSASSGALKEVLLPFKLGGGGIMGDPDHVMNWIHLEDAARILVMAVFNERMKGPYNATAPGGMKTSEYYRTLARVLNRPCLLRYPVPLLRAMIGEAAEYASGGPVVKPDKVRQAGYRFFFEDLQSALENVLRYG